MAIAGFGEIAEKLRRSTVLIRAGNRGNGSGIIWSAEGVIVTNAHVARSDKMHIELWDGREFDAVVTARDTRRDLAALQVEAKALPAAAAADSTQVRPGELAIAIGNPMGFVGALTTGVVHSVGAIRGAGSFEWVQSSVRLAPGNSGGPLADARGRVIGINTMIAGRVALAIPSSAVTQFLASGVGQSWLGITVYPVHVPRRGRRVFGLVLLEVAPDSPAARASLMSGDILLGTAEEPFRFVDDLSRSISGKGPGLLRLEFLRGDYAKLRRVTVQFGGPSRGKVSIAA
jgi:serine protease Do